MDELVNEVAGSSRAITSRVFSPRVPPRMIALARALIV